MTLNKVIIPIIRRVMPTVIANNIIGVSPMVGPTGSIFNLRMRYYDSSRTKQLKVDSGIYRHFLRINNRRNHQSDKDFADAGYFCLKLKDNWDKRSELLLWCEKQFGEHGFWYNYYSENFWFVMEVDLKFVELTWNDEDN